MKREILIALSLGFLLSGCESQQDRIAEARKKTGGDPPRGEIAIRKYGCNACHTIPGVGTASRTLGPSLDGIGSRPVLARGLPNNPGNMVNWIRDPRSIDPNSVMPAAGVSDGEAKDIAAYLYTLH